MSDYLITIISLVVTCIIWYIVDNLYNHYKRYKYYKKYYFESLNEARASADNKKSNFRSMLDKQLEDAQKQREDLESKQK